MYRLISPVIFILFITSINQAQSKYSFEGNLGIVSPINSSSGLSGTGQINYSLNDFIKLYSGLSYSQWDKYNVFYYYEYYTSANNGSDLIKTFSSANHTLVSINLGTRFKLYENKLLNLLFDSQIGLSFFSYTNYDLVQVKNPETGQIDLVPYLSSSQKVNETLFSFGIGPVFEHNINSSLSLYLSAKINTMINAGDSGFINKKGTYFVMAAGFTHAI